MPPLSTFKKITTDDNLNLQSDAIKNHQKHRIGYETIQEYMERDYKIPKSFEDYIYVSQLLQARGMQIAIEAHRSSMPYCMGTLYWQLNDCWPVTSWSSLDYYGNWKALHYQAKKSFEPKLLTVNEEDETYVIYGINDNDVINGNLELQLIDFEGKLLWKKTISTEMKSNTSSILYRIPKTDFSKFNLNKSILRVRFTNDDISISSLYYFAKPKNLELLKPEISITKTSETSFEIKAEHLVKNIYLEAENNHFSDNFFDVLPNEIIKITTDKPFSTINIKSLYDTMK